jgi:exopolyphosphatase/pppGpp-phosphohydrolase
MSHTWQNKALREAFEIAELIKYYEKHYGNHFEIIKKSREARLFSKR